MSFPLAFLIIHFLNICDPMKKDGWKVETIRLQTKLLHIIKIIRPKIIKMIFFSYFCDIFLITKSIQYNTTEPLT